MMARRDGQALIVRSDSKALPKWMAETVLEGYEPCPEEELEICPYDDLDPEQREIVHKRFTMVAPLILKAEKGDLTNKSVGEIAEMNGISEQTLIIYLRNYLVTQNISALAQKKRNAKRELSPDEKKMRWALNKWYYSWEKQTLQATYIKIDPAGEGFPVNKASDIYADQQFLPGAVCRGLHKAWPERPWSCL